MIYEHQSVFFSAITILRHIVICTIESYQDTHCLFCVRKVRSRHARRTVEGPAEDPSLIMFSTFIIFNVI